MQRQSAIAFPYIAKMATEYGQRLRQARQLAKLTQAGLSAKTGIAQSTISTAEREGHGSADTPTYAQACGVSALWLATGEGDMIPLFPQQYPPNVLNNVNAQEPSGAYRFVSLDIAVACIAKHLDETTGYDKPTAISLLTTLANSPDLHNIVAEGLKRLKPDARGDPAHKATPAPPLYGSGAA